jgi:hypothetical protein
MLGNYLDGHLGRVVTSAAVRLCAVEPTLRSMVAQGSLPLQVERCPHFLVSGSHNAWRTARITHSGPRGFRAPPAATIPSCTFSSRLPGLARLPMWWCTDARMVTSDSTDPTQARMICNKRCTPGWVRTADTALGVKPEHRRGGVCPGPPRGFRWSRAWDDAEGTLTTTPLLRRRWARTALIETYGPETTPPPSADLRSWAHDVGRDGDPTRPG